MVIHGRCFIQSQCKKFIDNTTNEKNGTSDGYSFSQANYAARKCGSGHNLRGDIPQGNATYDAATANAGSPWKIPTKAQCQELIDNTAHALTTMNGVNGEMFINKSNSSKYIFLPAAGYWQDTAHNSVGSAGYLWSTRYNSTDDCFNITSGNAAAVMRINYKRFGLPIRGIQ